MEVWQIPMRILRENLQDWETCDQVPAGAGDLRWSRDKVVTIIRAQEALTFPANFQLVGAMNPCLCR